MCGIVGCISRDFDQNLANRMRDCLEHRGPDSWGEWREKNIWLAHRRLAIMDLSSHGHQPMHSSCGRYVLTYNGEIYNYKELYRQLELTGWDFHGQSDTEVVLAACAVWGIEIAVSRFEGMFAFGLYDRNERMLWLARDSMGIKPLYYAHQGDQIAFSSELTPLLFLPWINRSIDRSALFSYFRYGCVPAPASILKGVKKLSSGTLLRFKEGNSTTKSFWNLPEKAIIARKNSVSNLSLQEAVDELDIRLRNSIKQHMQSDVPYGAFLSGGVDSSAVVALMQDQSSSPINTFSIGFSEKSHDESAYAKAVANCLGTNHHELIINSEDIPHLVPKVASHYDEPFADNSSIPTFLVSRFARESVKVCLSGDGGDELFGGYPRYFWAKRIENLRRVLSQRGAKVLAKLLQTIPETLWNRAINPMLGYRYSGAEGLAYRIRRFSAYLNVQRTDAYSQTMSFWKNPSELLNYQPACALGADAEHYPELPWAEEMMLVDQGNYLQDDILTKIDRASMAVSLESRVPLLTHPLVEFSWQIDSSLKFADKGDRGKLVLRNMLYRYVPKELIERPKQGFGMPVGQWLRGPLREWAEELLNKADLDGCGLDSDVVTMIWREHQAGLDRQSMLWTVLMYREWHQRVIGT